VGFRANLRGARLVQGRLKASRPLMEHDVHLRIPTDANHRIVGTNAVNRGEVRDILADIVADDPAKRQTGGAAEILSVREVARYLKLPVSTVYRLAERRKLPGHKVGRQWRFHKVVLDDWFRQHATSRRSTILVVDDETAIPELMVVALATTSREVLTAGSGEEALAIVQRSDVDLVVLDLVMPGMNGVDTFRAIHSLHPALPVMIVTGYPDSDLMAKALEIGPFTMISKPVDLAQIQKTVDRIVGS
jgi:excisionase family DNA binding protein